MLNQARGMQGQPWIDPAQSHSFKNHCLRLVVFLPSFSSSGHNFLKVMMLALLRERCPVSKSPVKMIDYVSFQSSGFFILLQRLFFTQSR